MEKRLTPKAVAIYIESPWEKNALTDFWGFVEREMSRIYCQEFDKGDKTSIAPDASPIQIVPFAPNPTAETPLPVSPSEFVNLWNAESRTVKRSRPPRVPA